MNKEAQDPGVGLDIQAIRAKLAGQTGRQYWRSLEEVADTPEFQTWMEDEFPNRSTLMQIDRRSLLKFMGAGMALAGLSGCRGVFLGQDKVVPYVRQPEELVPGKPMFYASAMVLGGYATGVLVEQHMGRPTRIEGNPEHPASLGASDSFSQAEILGLYDPDRSMNVLVDGDISTWETFNQAMTSALESQKAKAGAGIRILTGAVTSPTFTRLVNAFLRDFSSATWHTYEPAGRDNVHAGAALAFGRPLNPIYKPANARVIVSLDGDFLSPDENPGSLIYAREFAEGRRVLGKAGSMNRVYAFESTPGLVGAIADHRFVMRASDVGQAAAALAAALGLPVTGTPELPSGELESKIQAVARDLMAQQGAALVVAGKHQPPEVHQLALRMNEALGAFGKTIEFTEPVETTADSSVRPLAELAGALAGDTVDILIVIDCNPVYTAPADLDFANAFQKAKLRVVLGSHRDETAKLAQWHLPLAHPLESWGDARAFDGTISLVQPIVAPLFDGRSGIEFLSKLSGRNAMGYDLVAESVKRSGLGGADSEKFLRRCIHDGVVKGTAFERIVPQTNGMALSVPAKGGSGVELVFRTDPTIYDGRFANNGWLQELPKPLTKLTWDNAICVNPKMAAENGWKWNEFVELEVDGRKVKGGVFLVPGHPMNQITVHLGYGRTAGGTIATVGGDDGGGFNAYAIRTTKAPWIATVAGLKAVGGSANFSSTQGHHPLEDSRIKDRRDVMRDYTLAEYTENIDEWLEKWQEKTQEYNENSMFPEQVFEWKGEQWAMTVDMNTCIGCGACVTACQSENNIPVVGKVQVGKHREMHWLRIDRYYVGKDENPQVAWQPLMCVQCEVAPCEPVCPVAATVHSHDGLNQMVYNRCVGTRYCSNNCPYRVRRFNYLNYSDNQPMFATKRSLPEVLGVSAAAEAVGGKVGEREVPGPLHTPKANGIMLLKMLNNPDVTVRGRGVMEKCTYCVQRINNARIEAKKGGREIADGEIKTACQQACPTQTIVFGNQNDPNSKVSQLRKDPRAYLLLEELLTKPRTSHLAKLRNPNPELEEAKA
jgi:molybdopterin-containing oxidoreductase family iron-sulfur binding subunit